MDTLVKLEIECEQYDEDRETYIVFINDDEEGRFANLVSAEHFAAARLREITGDLECGTLRN